MAARCLLLTGVSGVGKSTIGLAIAQARPTLLYRSFGDVVREIVGPGADQGDDIRTRLDELVTPAVIIAAKLACHQEILSLGADQVMLLDSHTVTGTPYGVRATPDSSARLEDFGLFAIIHLVGEVDTIRSRRLADLANPRLRHQADSIVLEQNVLIATSIAYAQALQIPVYFVETNEDVGAVVDKALTAVDAALGWRNE